MKTRRSGMLFIGHAFKSVRERHLQALPDCRSSRAPAPLFFCTREKQQRITSGAHLAGGGMTTTVWRPRVRIDVPDVGDAENTDIRSEELSKKGTKRKSAPRHHGPCEHGVKQRSRCKVCSGCPHGRLRRSQCKECGGSGICEHGRHRSRCKECGGASICEHGRQRSRCKECGGKGICEHGRRRDRCKECGGSQICEHGRRRYRRKECPSARV